MKKLVSKIIVAIIAMVMALGFGMLVLDALDSEMEIREYKAKKYFSEYSEARRIMVAQYK